jgi:diguanylate cyclase (GGDEF)-like protein
MTSALKAQFRQRLSRDLAERSIPGIPVYVAGWSIIIFATGFHQQQPAIAYPAWLGFLFCGALRLVYHFIHQRLFDLSPRLSRMLFMVIVLMPAALWSGFFAYFIVLPDSATIKLLMVITTAGLCSGGMTSYAPHRPLAIGYILVMIVPACCRIALVNPGDRALLYLMITYMGFMVLLLLRGHREYWAALDNEAALAEKSRQLESIATTDALTGVFNRRHFNRILDREWRRGSRENRRLTLIMLEIDHFKCINDHFGHLAGDDYLKSIAAILATSFKRCTDVIARYGGEEFAILLPGTPMADVVVLADSLRQEIAYHRVKSGNTILKATVSIGIADCVPDHRTPSEALIGRADQALYRAKAGGRNCVRLADDALLHLPASGRAADDGPRGAADRAPNRKAG